jgi:hypothetical protein
MGELKKEDGEEGADRGPLIDIKLPSNDNSATSTKNPSSAGNARANPPTTSKPPVGDGEADEEPKKPDLEKMPACRFHRGKIDGKEKVSACLRWCLH